MSQKNDYNPPKWFNTNIAKLLNNFNQIFYFIFYFQNLSFAYFVFDFFIYFGKFMFDLDLNN